jgi:hypothetical protein
MDNQCSIRETFWYRSGCGLGSVPKSSVTFLGWKKYIYFVFFLVLKNEIEGFKIVKRCLMIKIKFLARNFYIFVIQFLFRSAQHFYEKRIGSESGSVRVTTGSGTEHSCIHVTTEPSTPAHTSQVRTFLHTCHNWTEYSCTHVTTEQSTTAHMSQLNRALLHTCHYWAEHSYIHVTTEPSILAYLSLSEPSTLGYMSQLNRALLHTCHSFISQPSKSSLELQYGILRFFFIWLTVLVDTDQ